MVYSLIGAVIGGIIATSVGIYLHYFVGDRKLKKRICQVLYDELDSNRSYLKKAVPLPGNMELLLPYTFLLNSYTEARNCGVFRELPKELREKIESYYSFLQFLNTYRFGTVAGETVKIELEPKNGVKGALVKDMDEVLPKLKEFCSNLRVYRII